MSKAGQLSSKGDQAGAIKAYRLLSRCGRPGPSQQAASARAAQGEQPTDALPLLDRAAENGFVVATSGSATRTASSASPVPPSKRTAPISSASPRLARSVTRGAGLDKLDKGGERPHVARSHRRARTSFDPGGYRPAASCSAREPPSQPARRPVRHLTPAPAPAEVSAGPRGETDP